MPCTTCKQAATVIARDEDDLRRLARRAARDSQTRRGLSDRLVADIARAKARLADTRAVLADHELHCIPERSYA